MNPQPFRAPYPVKTYQPRKRPRFVYRARLRKASCWVLAGVLGVLAGVFGDLHPALTLAASLGTFAAIGVALVNLFKLR